MSSLPDARRYSRHRVELTARLSCLDAERDPRTGRTSFRMMTVRTVDVSDGGLCIRADELVDCGRRVVLELDLPDGRTYDVAGSIVWLAPGAGAGESARMGVAFSEPSAGLVNAVS